MHGLSILKLQNLEVSQFLCLRKLCAAEAVMFSLFVSTFRANVGISFASHDY